MKKLLSIIAVILMVSMAASTMVFSVSAEGAWDGMTAATEFAGGMGTAEDPYLIANGEQFKYLAELINGNETNAEYNALSYKLAADIDLGGNVWYRIGNTELPFSGTFDGDGHTVSNFFVYEHPAGLFGSTSNATIKNLKIDTASYFATGGVLGGIVANVSEGTTLTLTNCEIGSNVLINLDNLSASARTGGFWGGANKNSTINATNCINRARIVLDNTGKNDSAAGGIGGVIRNGKIENCVNLGSVVINYEGTMGSYAGGIVGLIVDGGAGLEINNVINCANITGHTVAGGIVGLVHTGKENLVVSNAYSITNHVTSSDAFGTVVGSIRVEGQICNIKNVQALAIDGVAAVGGTVAASEENVVALTSIDTLAMELGYQAILTSLGLDTLSIPVPPAEETIPEGPVAPVVPDDSEEEDSDSEPEDTGSKPVDTPADTGDKTEPTTPVVTDPVTPETEKPAEGGCGSVVAGGIAILAVVALAGVALKKKD